MKMDRMVEFLENRGFKTEKRYITSDKMYEFVIIKDGIEVKDHFNYPSYAKDGYAIDRIQRDFLEKLIDKWGLAHKSTGALDPNKRKFSMTTNDIIDALRYAGLHGMDGILHIKDVDVPVKLTRLTESPSELPVIECNMIYPTKEMQKCQCDTCVRKGERCAVGYIDDSSNCPSYVPDLDTRLDACWSAYCVEDWKLTARIAKRMLNSKFGMNGQYGPQIEKVIFNNPATIVFWKDGDKTVVKAKDEEFDPEKGLAMAIAKKTLGNKHDYYNTFKKWLKKAPKDDIPNVKPKSKLDDTTKLEEAIRHYQSNRV